MKILSDISCHSMIGILTTDMEKDLSRNNRKSVYLQAFVRISKIHSEISSGDFPSVKRLAEIAGANERTIKRDLDVLRDQLNAPIIYERKQKGFRYAEIGWTLPLSNLTEKDLLAIFIAENALKLTGHLPEANDLKRALAKLASYLPEQISYDLATLSENISFENPAFEVSEPEIRLIIAKAASDFSTIEFDYFSPHSQKLTHRRADVYLLHNFGGDWYAVSFDHHRKEMRDFHLGRISNLKITNDGFEIRKKIWNKADYLKKGFNMVRGGKMTEVSIWFDPYQAQWIRKRKFFNPDEIREELPDNSLRLSFTIGENGLESVARFCLQYAGNCIAEKPQKLREIIKEKLIRALEKHK